MLAVAILLLAVAAWAARAPIEIDLDVDDVPSAGALTQLHGDLGGSSGEKPQEVQWVSNPHRDRLLKLYKLEVDQATRKPKHLDEDGLGGYRPRGEFISSADGITHYVLHGPPSPTAPIAVLAHGIGHRLDDFDDFVPLLLSAGFRVLTYDYYGHGWSWFGPKVELNLDTMLRQLRELLDHVFPERLSIDLFVGHSAGGVMGVEAAMKLPAREPESRGRRIDKLALISPGFWKEGNWFVQFLDMFPGLARGVAKVAPGEVKKAFLEAEDNAFAHNGTNYAFHDAHKAAMQFWQQSFELKTQAKAGLVSMGTHMFSAKKQKKYMDDFKELVSRLAADGEADQGDNQAVEICLLWGTEDEAVPYRHHKEIVQEWKGGDHLRFEKLQGMGHESPLEDGEKVAREIVGWYRR